MLLGTSNSSKSYPDTTLDSPFSSSNGLRDHWPPTRQIGRWDPTTHLPHHYGPNIALKAHVGPHAPCRGIPWISVKSIYYQQESPASLNPALFSPSPNLHAHRVLTLPPYPMHMCMHALTLLCTFVLIPPTCHHDHSPTSPWPVLLHMPLTLAIVMMTMMWWLCHHDHLLTSACFTPLLPSPIPPHTHNNNTVMMTMRQLCHHDRHAIIMTTCPHLPPPGPFLPLLTPTRA